MNNITSPCCGATLTITTRQEGPAYLSYDVPDEILCNGEGCYNSWDANGIASEWNK